MKSRNRKDSAQTGQNVSSPKSTGMRKASQEQSVGAGITINKWRLGVGLLGLRETEM